MASHFINGQRIDGTGEPLQSVCPATGQVVWQGRTASAADVAAACESAKARFPSWALLPPVDRAAVIVRFKEELSKAKDDIARAIGQEIGKPLWEARTEVASMINKVDISLRAYDQRTGTNVTATAEADSALRHKPHGVLAVLGPYNFPGHLPNGHIVPALLAGNTVVFKPSEFAPRVGLLTVDVWARAGLPAGVLNVVNGGRDTGMALTGHDTIDGVLFTGSYQTGVALHQQFAGRPEKMLALEMGGNNPLVAWQVRHIDAAVHHIVMSAFVSAGQRCTCARRLIVADDADGECLLARLVDVTARLRIGKWDADPQPFMGPVVSAKTAAGIYSFYETLVRAGAKPLLAMQYADRSSGFLSPGIVDVSAISECRDEEIFGPLLQIIRVPTFADAIASANQTTYGLAAGLLCEDRALYEQFFAHVRAGIVNWNRPTTGASSSAPFGGVGRSGNHRPSAFYAADYCAYPVVSLETAELALPSDLSPGLSL
ncbi:MAG: succinylglutamate-semialdehyde dehydrogenase [Gammaproteobacteria bacterium]|nr:succinylglutamate-semialdehyde dehydrogenase [Gammaproteobacteria bacterium]